MQFLGGELPVGPCNADIEALKRFAEKVHRLDEAVEFDPRESRWFAILDSVHRRFQRRIGRQQSHQLSCGAIRLCLEDGTINEGKMQATCVKAHRASLYPPRRGERRKHDCIDEVDESATIERHDTSAVDDAVQEALAGLGEADQRLLRECYMDKDPKSTK